MVGIRSRAKPARGYRLAAAALSFLFIGVVVLDFGRSFTGASFAPAAPREMIQEALPEAAMDAVEEPALMAEEAEMADRSVEESQDEDTLAATEAPPAVAAEAVEEEAVGMAEEGEAKTAGEPGEDTAVNQGDPDQDREPDEEVAAEPEPSPTNAQLPTQEPQTPDQPEVYFEEPLEIQSADPGVNWIRVLEWILGLGAVGFGVLGWIKRRRS